MLESKFGNGIEIGIEIGVGTAIGTGIGTSLFSRKRYRLSYFKKNLRGSSSIGIEYGIGIGIDIGIDFGLGRSPNPDPMPVSILMSMPKPQTISAFKENPSIGIGQNTQASAPDFGISFPTLVWILLFSSYN